MVKCDGTIGLPIYGFLLDHNINIWPNSVPSRHICLRNMSDIEAELSRSDFIKEFLVSLY